VRYAPCMHGYPTVKTRTGSTTLPSIGFKWSDRSGLESLDCTEIRTQTSKTRFEVRTLLGAIC